MKNKIIMAQVAAGAVALGFMAGVLVVRTTTPRPQKCDWGHGYGVWSNDWEKPNDFGFMRQHRVCTNCGYYQVSR